MKHNIESVKFEITDICNFKCKYCFAGHRLQGKKLSCAQAFKLINSLAAAGCKKLSFIGGEPTLCDWLPELIKYAKSLGLVTTIVTNGTGLTDTFLSEVSDCLDWVCISVDSLYADSLNKIGRICRGNSIDPDFYYKIVDKVKKAGYRLKINTVVSSVNCGEDLSDFINYAMPERWRIFQVMPITARACEFAISIEMFSSFRNRHRKLINPVIDADFDENAILSAEYILLDPIGRFFQNVSGEYRYSSPILDVGVEQALNQVFAEEKKPISPGLSGMQLVTAL